jgi:flavin-dependent dehydrogenase
MFDLIVIGGGPAGSSAAISAARTGARVLLLERGRFPRQKVCGEFVSAESLGLLGNLLDANHRSLLTGASRIEQTRVFLDDQALHARIHPAAASIARLDLDDALWNSTEAVGAETRQQVTVQQVRGSAPFEHRGRRFRSEGSGERFRQMVKPESRACERRQGQMDRPQGAFPRSVAAGFSRLVLF